MACHASLGSTNDEAMALLRAGDPGGIIVVAESQTGGRGRHGRHWASPRGNLHASLALLDPAPLATAPQLGFVAGVALATVLRARLFTAPGGPSAARSLTIKWPNDMLFGGAKLAGILLESVGLSDGRLACVVGFGVNCRSHPEGLAYPATNLQSAGDPDATPDAVLRALAVAIETSIAIWDRGAGFAAIRASWLDLAAGLGAPVTVALPRRTITGIYRDIDAEGRLVIDTDRGCVTVAAGDVFLAGDLSNDMQDQNVTPTGVGDGLSEGAYIDE